MLILLRLMQGLLSESQAELKKRLQRVGWSGSHAYAHVRITICMQHIIQSMKYLHVML